MEFQLGAMLFLLLLSGFFSGSETAFFSLPPELEESFPGSRNPLDRIIGRLLEDPGSLLSTILLGNLAVNVLYFSLAASTLEHLEGFWEKAGLTLGALLLLLVLGEIVPKTLAMGMPLRAARVVAPPLSFFHLVFGPPRKFLAAVAGWFLGDLAREGEEERRLTPPEVAKVIHGKAGRFGLDSRTAALLREVVELGELKVREVMIPRVDLPAFDLDEGIEGIKTFMMEKALPWAVVFRGDLDRALGMVTARRIFLEDDGAPLIDRIRKLPAVPEVARLEAALEVFRKGGVDFAFAVDEYGGLAGLLSAEHLAEAIVGELSEEYEKPGDEIRQVGKDCWHIEGTLSAREWAERFLPDGEIPAKVETVGGLTAWLLGRIPAEGDRARFGPYLFEVLKVRKKRVVLLEMTRLEEEGGGKGGPGPGEEER